MEKPLTMKNAVKDNMRIVLFFDPTLIFIRFRQYLLVK